jgi:hypothetical protein
VAALAAGWSVDVIMVETPPFFNVALWIGAFPPVSAYDYGEPPAELFVDAPARQEAAAAKAQAFRAASRVLTISPAVAEECPVVPDGIVPIANSELGKWGPERLARLAGPPRRARCLPLPRGGTRLQGRRSLRRCRRPASRADRLRPRRQGRSGGYRRHAAGKA